MSTLDSSRYVDMLARMFNGTHLADAFLGVLLLVAFAVAFFGMVAFMGC